MGYPIQLVRNAAIAIAICLAALTILFFSFAPPRFIHMTLTDQKGYETAEVRMGKTAQVLRDDVQHSRRLGLIHHLRVGLEETDKNFRMVRYEGALTFGGERSPEVLTIHPNFRGTHMQLNWLRRQYENKTGKPFDTLNYIFLTAPKDGKEKFSQVMLDFSLAGGGVLEYTPPTGWPHSDLLRRILYSMTLPPVGGYKKDLPLYLDQKSRPYGMETTFFTAKFRDITERGG